MDCRANVYVSAITGGTTWQFRIVGVDTSAASANLVAPTTGWWLSTASLASGLAHTLRTTTVDTVKVQVQRTVGVGSITLNGLSYIEDPAA